MVKTTYTWFSMDEQQKFGRTADVELEIYIENAGCFTAYASLPKGLYNVSWVPKGPNAPVIDAITVDSKPEEVTCDPAKLLPGPRWSTMVDNRCGAVGRITYEISGRDGKVPFTHDPTIAVTGDPPPPGCEFPLGAKRGAREAGGAAQRVEEG